MAKRKIWFGSIGPFIFDDGARSAVVTDGDMILEDANAGANTLSYLASGGAAAALVDDVGHIIVLTGVAVDAENLGSFDGTTIPDGSTIKVAIQALETLLESVSGVASGAADDVGNLATLSGVAVDSTNLGAFTGTTIPDNKTVKEALQSLETAIEGIGAGTGLVGDGVAGRVVRMSRLRFQKGTSSGIHLTMYDKWNGDTADVDNLAAGASSGGFTYYNDKYRVKVDTPAVNTVVGVIASIANNLTGSSVIVDSQVDGTGIFLLLSRDDGSNIDLSSALAAASLEFSIDLFYVTTS